MPVKVQCSSCDKAFAVPDAARGKAVKCPKCEARVAVPAEDSAKPVAAKKKVADKAKKPASKAAKEAKPPDSEDFLKTLDLRRVEDTSARICPKCGFDMQDVDEEESECPKCGFDIEAGGLGAKARKKQMKGPDPADFFPDLVAQSWKFVLKNQLLAWRTDAYILASLVMSGFCAFMYLWISAWPPRYFFILCFAVSFLVTPGWLWVLDSEVIKLTLERKDKFKKLNFDFFLASSKGVMFLGWMIAVGVPLLAIPGGIGWYLVNYAGQPDFVFAIFIGIGLIPVMWVMPVVMSHMTMPISVPGWMFWKVIQISCRCAGGLSYWLLWLFLTSIPLIAGAAVVGAVWGEDLTTLVKTMESNADIRRRVYAAETAPKPTGKNKPQVATPDPASIGTPADVDFKPLIGPSIILAVMCLPIGFIAMFNMRTNGQFTFFFRDRLELEDKAKEYKYVAKERRNEDDDDKPATLQQDAVEGIVFVMVFSVLGAIGGMLYGSFTDVGMAYGVSLGAYIGCRIAYIATWIGLIAAGFRVSVAWGFVNFIPLVNLVFIAKHWETSRKLFFQWITSFVLMIVFIIVFAFVLIATGQVPVAPAEQPAQMPAEQMMPQGPGAGAAPGPVPASGAAHGS